jgi:hypothetical protein
MFNAQLIYEYGEPQWNDSDRVRPKNSEKNLSATLSIKNPTCTDPGTNPGLRGRRPVTDSLSHETLFVELLYLLHVI